MKTQDIIIIVIAGIVIGIATMVFRSWIIEDITKYSIGEAIDTFWDPIQSEHGSASIPIIQKGKKMIIMTPLAKYELSGLLVSKRDYHYGMVNSLSPWDFAVAWGQVPQLMEYIKFKQVVRYCLFRYAPGAPVNPAYINSHMSNNHLIPANKNIRRAMSIAARGNKVRIMGYLVNVQIASPERVYYQWNSSTTRTDEGNGACEIIYVTALQIEDRLYQ